MTDPGPPGPPATTSAVLLVARGRLIEERLDIALEPAGRSPRLMGALRRAVLEVTPRGHRRRAGA